jgi:hypothetical protein
MKKVMTVDFDDTLAATITSGWGGTSLKPISRIMNFVFDKVRSGEWEAHIVSFRSEDDKQEMVDFVKGYKLPIKSITCTSSKNKTPFLKKIGSKLHIDDNVEVCTLAYMAGIECLLVDHGQEDKNEMAKLFPKI